MFQLRTIESNYSDLQILRFSNNHGSSLLEITFFSQIPIILNYLSVGCVLALQSTFKIENVFLLFVFEFFSIIFPLIIFLTLASHLSFLLYVFSILIMFFIFIRKDRRRFWSSLETYSIGDEKLPGITVFRATVNVFTVICILAADFTCFPRRFLKTESYGYGLMDTGVGLFIMIYSFTDSPYKPRRSLRSSTYKILPFFILGLGRYLSTSALNYQHQVTEYGTQWNFFMTLLTITLFNAIVLNFIRSTASCIFTALLILVIHESSLALGLKDWIISDAPRLDFISGNREGIFSLLGYEILYLSGMIIKHFLPKRNDSFRKYILILPQYLTAFLLCLALTKLAELSVGVSRRTANSGYIFWILSLTFLTFTTTFICDISLRIYFYGKKPCGNSSSLIMNAVNYNGLTFFLLGNVLTGLINLSTRTLFLNNMYGILIISAYTFFCCALSVLLYQKNIRLR